MPLNRRSFLQSALLAGSAIKLRALNIGSRSAGTTDIATLRAQFRTPPKKFRPIARWWWPGDDVTDTELLRELSALDDAWFGGAEIQAFNKAFPPDLLSKELDRIDGFATESFFRHVATAARGARDRGLFIDYTFGSGWPFGGGDAITPELAAIELRSSHLSVEGPATFHSRLQIPSITDGDPLHGSDALKDLPAGWAARMQNRAKIAAVIAVRGSEPQFAFHQQDGRGRAVFQPGELLHDTAIDLTANLQPDGLLHWEIPAGTWQLFVFRSMPSGQRLNAGAGAGPQLVMDHLSAEAFRAHAHRVGDAAIPFLKDVLGNGMRAIFCDSLEVRGNIFWSDDFLAEFKRRRGYDLQPFLPILQVQTTREPFARFVDIPFFDMKDIGDQVRHDYRLTVADLMTERFYSNFNRWAHDHKLLSRTQAHGAPVDVLRVYEDADIPETEQLYDEGCYDFLKLASSAAHISGRALVGSESFVWPSAAYQTTPEKMKLAADELFTAGINAIVFHGFAYQVPGIPAPGWHPFNGIHSGNYSSQFNELNPLWPYFAQVNRYLSRLQFILQSAKTVPAVALFRDTLTHGAEEQPPTPPLNQAIMDAGYFYDHINGDSLLQSKVENKSLITVAGTKYRALVLPSIDSLPADVAEKIESFASAGLPVLFAGDLPTRASGFKSHAEDTPRVQRAMTSIRKHPSSHAAEQIPGLISSLRAVAAPNIRFHGDPFFFIQKRLDDTSLFFLRNESDQPRKLDAEFEATGEPELWNPWTGEITSLPFTRTAANRIAIKLDVDPLSSALIAFSPNSAQRPSPAKASSSAEIVRLQEIGTNGWSLVATESLPEHGSRTIRRNLPLLIDWSLDPDLRSFSGRGIYTTSFTVPSDLHDGRVTLNLGDVREVADIRINGTPAGSLLLRPYTIDITDHVRPGENALEVAVTNTLFNAMALRTPRAFTPGPTENSSGLMSGGLIGPVRIIYTRAKS